MKKRKKFCGVVHPDRLKGSQAAKDWFNSHPKMVENLEEIHYYHSAHFKQLLKEYER
jgi:hypothetical protein